MPTYDVILRGGAIYDGSGGAPYTGDVALSGDVIAAVGDLGDADAALELDVSGLAVAPGFINMLSWATESLIEDGRSQSDIRQGVTLEVMGEGASMGPLNETMKATGPGSYMAQGDIVYDVSWTTLGEYLEFLEQRGVSCNVASFVGSETVRIHAMGYDDRAPTDDEMQQMKALVRQAMEEGAVGLSAALIYPPAYYADMDELIALASVAAEYDGLYISHIRGEGSAILDALDEFITIVDAAGIRGEIYHLKVAGSDNWALMDDVIAEIEAARAEGLPITADMYTYPYSGTGLTTCIPPWAHEGGFNALVARLQNPDDRDRIKADMAQPSDEWENMFLANNPEGILLAGFKRPELKALTGRTLADVAAERGTPPDDTLLDLIVEDNSRVFAIYFSMSEDNLRKQVVLPWVSFCSDAASLAPEGVFLKTNPHPRAYGAFARLLAKYVRDEQLVSLEEAVRRLTSFPAENLKLDRRGALKPGFYADVIAFDPALVQDHATPENPHQYAAGMIHVFVNGAQVLRDGEHTGAKPGRVVRGPGWKKKPFEMIYPEALHPLLTLPLDYGGSYFEFNLTARHIPDLIRLGTDERLLLRAEDDPYRAAPVHAWRNLGLLRAQEAIKPLTQTFLLADMLVAQEMPDVFALFGAPAVPVLGEILVQPRYFPLMRVMALVCLRRVGDNSTTEARTLIVRYVVQALSQYGQNPRYLNAYLIRMLLDVGAGDDAAPLIAAAYHAHVVDEELAGRWADIKKRLPPLDDTEFDDEIDSAPRSARKADPERKKKAKRKQAEKIKKLNRKKR